MRRLLVSIPFLFGLLAVVMFATVAPAADVAADNAPAAQPSEPLVVTKLPTDWLPAEISIADLEPLAPNAAPAADTCAAATPLTLSFAQTADGSGTLTNSFTHEPGDPVPACTFGAPTNATGYRTAWHVLIPGDTGFVTITTQGSNYDTILTIHDLANPNDTCATLRTLSCADDTLGFLSKTTFPVIRGRTYYIQVADFQRGAPATADLRISATLARGGQRWQQISNIPRGGVTRHAFASLGVDMFVIGGQTRLQGTPILSNKVQRYNVELNRWTEMADILGPGLSNTTAARLGNNVYVPGGFDGNMTDYANTHLVYNIEHDFWAQGAPIPTNLLPGGQMFAWSSAVSGPGETSYYVTGGTTSLTPFIANSAVITNTYRYTPSTNLWEASRPMTTPRFAHTAAWVGTANRGLCVVGGLSNGANDAGQPILVLLTGGECYNPATGAGWRPTGDLNFPRYNAGSAVGPDDRWYVFGGIDAAGNRVPETEVFEATTNTWTVLGSTFTLSGQANDPGIEWPRGAFWGDHLYVFGGNTPREQRVVSAVERLTIGAAVAPHRAFVPITPRLGSENLLSWATYLPINSSVRGNFVHPEQFYNSYYFDWPIFGRAGIRLRGVPSDTNYNIAVYDAGKVLLGESNTAVTGNKEVWVTALPGRYYVVVERIFPKDLPNPNVYYEVGVFTP